MVDTYGNLEKDHYDRGYKDGRECADCITKRAEADEVFDELGVHYCTLTKDAGAIPQNEAELDQVYIYTAYWSGVILALNERAIGV